MGLETPTVWRKKCRAHFASTALGAFVDHFQRVVRYLTSHEYLPDIRRESLRPTHVRPTFENHNIFWPPYVSKYAFSFFSL